MEYSKIYLDDLNFHFLLYFGLIQSWYYETVSCNQVWWTFLLISLLIVVVLHAISRRLTQKHYFVHTTQVSSFELWYGGHSRLPHLARTAYICLPCPKGLSPPIIDSASWSTQINWVADLRVSWPAAKSPWYWRFQPGVHTSVPGIISTERSSNPLHTTQGTSLLAVGPKEFDPYSAPPMNCPSPPTSFRTGWDVKQTAFAAPPTLWGSDPPMNPRIQSYPRKSFRVDTYSFLKCISSRSFALNENSGQPKV